MGVGEHGEEGGEGARLHDGGLVGLVAEGHVRQRPRHLPCGLGVTFW